MWYNAPSHRFERENIVAETASLGSRLGHQLIRWGMALFLLGLLTGFVIPAVANPRMGLTSHLEGVMNGTVLMAFGVFWPRLRLGAGLHKTAFWLALFGSYMNWGTTLLAALLGAGESMMPIASSGHAGTGAQELIIQIGLVSLSFAMVAVAGIVLYGLRGPAPASD